MSLKPYFSLHSSPTSEKLSNFLIAQQPSGDRKTTPAEEFSPLVEKFNRRLLLGVGSSSVLAIGANFGGITSFRTWLSPEVGRNLKLDVVYPIGGYSRCIDTVEGFEFIYPATWVGDQTTLYRAAEKSERENSLDLPPARKQSSEKTLMNRLLHLDLPVRPASSMSVLSSPLSHPVSRKIEAFGGPKEVGEAIVRTVTGSGQRTDLKGTLLESNLRQDSERNFKYYELEFKVESPLFRRHNVAICCAHGGRLYTLNAQAPESAWSERERQMAMPRATSGPAYPERFYAAASYVGLDGSDSSAKNVSSKFSDDTALLLYALYHQATVGPCNTPKPSAWRPVEQSKWRRIQMPHELGIRERSILIGLGTMPSIEAMRLFVKILEEDDPGWYSRASNDIPDLLTKDEPVVENGNSFGETKTISTENGRLAETQDKDVVSEDSNTVSVYNQWTAPQTSGQRPKARYEHGAAVIQDKMYIYGGNHNGRYLGDLHVLDLKNWTWSRVETKVATDEQETSTPTLLAPCAGHSLIAWDKQAAVNRWSYKGSLRIYASEGL
ncbi:unnamed protein product [Arabidopsis arenosa]|uniref:ACB domain-containing protein n=1 Tax=Arabidopsis arenosa TaxID=38785 RepID=A0A8S1ZYU0_ARAAE|nr:unnamed protein product [Arabidopsis arenosa]